MSRNKKKKKNKNSTKPTINESETSTSNTGEVQTAVMTIAGGNRISTADNQAASYSPQAVTEEMDCDIYSYRSTYKIQAAGLSLLPSEGNLFDQEMKKLVDAMIVCKKARIHISDMTYLHKNNLKELFDENKSIRESISLKLDKLLKGRRPEFVNYVMGYISCLSQISYLKDEKSLSDEDVLLAYEEIKMLREQCGANAQVTMAIAGTNEAISYLETRVNKKKTDDIDIVDDDIQKAINAPHNVVSKKDEKKGKLNNRCANDIQSKEKSPQNVTEEDKEMRLTKEMQDETRDLKELASAVNEQMTTTDEIEADPNELRELYENTKVVDEANNLIKEQGKVEKAQKKEDKSVDDIQEAAHFSAIMVEEKKGPKGSNSSFEGFQTTEYSGKKVTEGEEDTKGFNKYVPDIQLEDNSINMERDLAIQIMRLEQDIEECAEKENDYFENMEIMPKKISPKKTKKMTNTSMEFQWDLKVFLALQNSIIDEKIKERNVPESKSEFLKKKPDIICTEKDLVTSAAEPQEDTILTKEPEDDTTEEVPEPREQFYDSDEEVIPLDTNERIYFEIKNDGTRNINMGSNESSCLWEDTLITFDFKEEKVHFGFILPNLRFNSK